MKKYLQKNILRKALHNITALALGALLFAGATEMVSAQCTAASFVAATFPGTYNGVTVNRSYGGDASSSTQWYNNNYIPYTNTCGQTCPMGVYAIVQPATNIPFAKLGSYATSGDYTGTVTYTFNKDVNDIVLFILHLEGQEAATFTTDGGGVVTAQGISICNLTQTGNRFAAGGAGGASNVGGFIKVSSTLPYRSLTVTGTGARSNAAFSVSFCTNSVVEATPNATLSKSVSPATITDGGTATYTFSIANTAAGNVAKTGLNFTDNLPSGLRLATNPNVTLSSNLTAGSYTATGGGTSVSFTGYSLPANATGTITVNVTNASGQTNTSCTGNPGAFTNGASNMTGLSSNLTNSVGNVCLVVNPCGADTAQVPVIRNTLNN